MENEGTEVQKVAPEVQIEPQKGVEKQAEPEIMTSGDEIKAYIRSLRRENKAYREKLREVEQEFEKVKSFATKYKELEERYKNLENSVRESLLAKLPEGKREKYKDWEIEKLQTLVTDLEELEKTRLQSPGQISGRPLQNLDFEKMTQEELAELRKTSPEVYYQKLQEYMQKKYVLQK
ncbi:MAG: hypothetical protein N2560_08780 [Ignavibacteria bacterium]|nr:hypothetical protein [Ignavibacteria bacterium]